MLNDLDRQIVRLSSAFSKIAVALILLITAVAFTNHAAAQLCGKATIQTKAVSYSLGKFGFTECETSSPPKRFLQQSVQSIEEGTYYYPPDTSYGAAVISTTTTYTHDEFSDSILGTSCSGTCTDGNVYGGGLTNITSIDTNTCDWVDPGQVNTDANFLFDYPDATIAFYDDLTTSTTCTSTTSGTLTGDLATYFPEEDVTATYTNQMITTLSDEYTDSMLAANIRSTVSSTSFPGTWANASASGFYTISADHLSGSGGKMQYRWHVGACQLNMVYRIKWLEVTTFPSGSTSVTKMQEEVPGNGDQVNGAYSSMREVDMPSTPSSISEVFLTMTIESSTPPGQ